MTDVVPHYGGTAGGTRIIIKGSGFSTNTNPVGNIVTIDDILCEVVPLHSTVNQIVCKTPPHSEIRNAVVRVIVDGVHIAKCERWYHCDFSYYNCE